ncbi:trans-sialidase [Nitrosopumilus cobalaminigenes]|uniref:Trans-sialidase n=1 Tax=Nitrosopumilus cobalaminigenes TaxID=1470066 RepID=A0A7D5QZJ9_9ARCH|nr:trans-sialidase [Nitrosopumilus cobalaminigenes]QLH02578.1 trans-sialidase [Nitrosopumilus cobalaminigenes]
MAGKTKASTKKDLESKIAELEAKLTKLSTQLEAKPSPKPAETKPAEVKPAETKPAPAKPAERPAATTKPKGTLPKGMGEKPAEAPKPAETTAQPPAPTTVQDALENAYMTAPMTSFHDYRAKVTGYSPAPNRYFVRLTAPVGKVPTKNWNDQKATVTGYTACSNQYYATRARLAHHPPGKTFGSFSGVNMTVEGVDAKAQTQQTPPPEPPKPAKGKLPKGMEQTQQAPPPQQSTYVVDDGKSREEKLADYEADYLQRLEQQRKDEDKAFDELLEKEAKARSTANRGTLPKGFEPKPEPEAPKASRGTLPKGF